MVIHFKQRQDLSKRDTLASVLIFSPHLRNVMVPWCILVDRSSFENTDFFNSFLPQNVYTLLGGYICGAYYVPRQKTSQGIYSLYRLNSKNKFSVGKQSK